MQSAYGSAEFYALDPGSDDEADRLVDRCRRRALQHERSRAGQAEAGRSRATTARRSASCPPRNMATCTPPRPSAVQQLEAIGFVMDHQVIDWATVVERRAKPEEWDMFVTGHGFVPDPSQISYVGQMNIYPGWWDSEDSLAAGAPRCSLPVRSRSACRSGSRSRPTPTRRFRRSRSATAQRITLPLRQGRGVDAQFERGFKYWNLWIEG